MTVSEKVSYLKGLMEGMEFDTDSKEGKLIGYIAEILEDMADEIADTQGDVDEINEYLEALDEDLTTVEEELFGDDFDDEDEEDCCCEDCCGHDDCFEVLCPHCKEAICFEEAPEGESVACPVCNKEIPLD